MGTNVHRPIGGGTSDKNSDQVEECIERQNLHMGYLNVFAWPNNRVMRFSPLGGHSSAVDPQNTRSESASGSVTDRKRPTHD